MVKRPGWITYAFVLIIVGAAFYTGVVVTTKWFSVPTPSSQPEQSKSRVVELGTIELDLKEFSHLSKTLKEEIFTTIDSVSTQRKLPPMLIHLVCRIESAYRFWVEHPQVVITIKGKKVPIQATGLGGIVWEIWGDTLQKAGIAQTRADLFVPRVNLQAMGLIFSVFADQAVKTSDEGTILPVLISKYYGQFDKDYEAKMLRYSSDLFWKRISREIVNLRSPSPHK